MMITHMTDAITATDINEHNAFTAGAATSSAWPYSACSGILDRKLAANIRAWALTRMSQAELHSYSQRRLLSMYLEQHIRPTLERVAPWMRMSGEGPEGGGALRSPMIGAHQRRLVGALPRPDGNPRLTPSPDVAIR
jgi:hypothetical protein